MCTNSQMVIVRFKHREKSINCPPSPHTTTTPPPFTFTLFFLLPSKVMVGHLLLPISMRLILLKATQQWFPTHYLWPIHPPPASLAISPRLHSDPYDKPLFILMLIPQLCAKHNVQCNKSHLYCENTNNLSSITTLNVKTETATMKLQSNYAKIF